MAQVIGNVKSFEAGTFFVKEANGQIRQLQIGDSIYDGENVYGASTNAQNATIVVDVILPGAGDVVIAGNGALTFDTSAMGEIFSHQDAVVYVNAAQDAMAASDAKETMVAANEEGDVTDAGETAAGDAVTDTERAADIFAARTGAIGDVTTGLLDPIGGTGGTSATDIARPIIEANVLAGESSPSAITPLSDAPKLDVELRAVESEYEDNFDFDNVSYSSFGIGTSYILEDGKLIMDDEGNVPSLNSTVYWNHGNGYGITTTDEGANNKHQINAGEALVLDLKTEVDSITIPVKHLLHDTPVSWQAFDSDGNLVGEATVSLPANDSIHEIEISTESDMQYIVFLGGDDGYSVKGPVDYEVPSPQYEYALDINEASLSDINETLGNVVVTGLPAGAVLVHDFYPDIIVPSDGTVTFGTETAPTSWSLILDDELPIDSSIVASLISTEDGADSAMTAVGVYGDNDIAGGDGNDILIGGDGDDALSGGEGNDTLVSDIHTIGDTLYGDTQADAIDGSEGTDTLVLTEGSSIDFSAVVSANNPITGIEVIDLSENGDHQLQNISHQDIIDMTGGGNILTILGDSAADYVSVDGTTMQYDGTSTEMINGVSYDFDIYSSISGTDPTVTLRVENIITDVIA